MTRAVSEAARDLNYGVRLIRRNPGLSAIAIAMLAIAIASNTAVFSTVNALFFTPLEASDAGRLLRVYPGESGVSLPDFMELRERATSFVDLVAQRSTTAAFMIGQRPRRVRAGIVSANYFTMLGVAPLTGRPFLPSDSRADLVVVGERFWRTQLGADPAILGKTVVVDGRSYRGRRPDAETRSRHRSARLLVRCLAAHRPERTRAAPKPRSECGGVRSLRPTQTVE